MKNEFMEFGQKNLVKKEEINNSANPSDVSNDEKFPKSEQFEADTPIWEKMDNAEFMEVSRKIGDAYASFLSSLADRMEFDLKMLEELPKEYSEKIIKYIKIIDADLKLLKSETTRKGVKPGDIFGQLFKEAKAGQELLDLGECIFEESSDGVYIFHLESKIFKQINPGARAFFCKGEEMDIPFIVAPDYRDEKHKDYSRREKEENIPHEINHLAWHYLKKKGILECDESDEEIKKAFLMFQEELIAKLASNGGLMSNSHLNTMHSKKREEYEKNYPEKVKEINAIVGSLNSLLFEDIGPLISNSSFKKSDLIFAINEARNFDELKKILNRWKDILEKESQNKRIEND